MMPKAQGSPSFSTVRPPPSITAETAKISATPPEPHITTRSFEGETLLERQNGANDAQSRDGDMGIEAGVSDEALVDSDLIFDRGTMSEKTELVKPVEKKDSSRRTKVPSPTKSSLDPEDDDSWLDEISDDDDFDYEAFEKFANPEANTQAGQAQAA